MTNNKSFNHSFAIFTHCVFRLKLLAFLSVSVHPDSQQACLPLSIPSSNTITGSDAAANLSSSFYDAGERSSMRLSAIASSINYTVKPAAFAAYSFGDKASSSSSSSSISSSAIQNWRRRHFERIKAKRVTSKIVAADDLIDCFGAPCQNC